MAYAVLSDVAPHQARYLRSHEGLGAISFDTAGGTDFSGFDQVLGAIHGATNPRAQLGAALRDRTVLWVDTDADDVAFGRAVLEDAAADAGGSSRMVQVANAAAAAEFLSVDGADLVIADWAPSTPGGIPTAEELLTTMRADGLRAPVIALSQHPVSADERLRAIRLGVTEVALGWGDLFRELSRIFAPASLS